MKRTSPNSNQNIYEDLDPLPGLNRDPIERETMAHIHGILMDQKREQNRRALPELTPACTAETHFETVAGRTDDAPVFVAQALIEAKTALWLRLLRKALTLRVGLFVLLCFLFLSGVLSTAMLFASVLVLLCILIFGPEPVLDAIFPNWRDTAVEFGELPVGSWCQRGLEGQFGRGKIKAIVLSTRKLITFLFLNLHQSGQHIISEFGSPRRLRDGFPLRFRWRRRDHSF